MLHKPALGRLALLTVAISLASYGHAAAHPLGNFTINHLADVRPVAGGLRIHYVLDIAEIPTFQIMHAQSTWSAVQMRAWAMQEARRVSDGFSITANGAGVPMSLVQTAASTRAGAGGLPTLYWTGDYTATLPKNASVRINDGVYADRRIGWKDIVLPGTIDPTDALRSYPSALIGSPRHNDGATFDVTGGRISHAAISGDATPSAGALSMVRSSALSDLFSRDNQTPLFVLLTVLAAFGLGALHGLEPGHGKALLAFTLVGARATFKQAAILAGALTFAHTIAVLLLGLLLFFVAGFASESLFGWITLVSGVAVAAIGARSLAKAAARWAPVGHQHAGHDHAHDHAHDHPHDHEHHDHGPHGHSHTIPGSAPLHFPTAVVAAMSGGIAPCPAAIVVLLTALHLHRVGYGLILIVVFSLGLAAILTGLGMAVVRGAAWLQRRAGFDRLARIAPLLTGAVISVIGATMLAQALVDRGIALPNFAIVSIALLLIAAFALISRYRYRAMQPT